MAGPFSQFVRDSHRTAFVVVSSHLVDGSMADYGLSKSFSEHSLSVSSAQSSSGSESSGTRNLVASNLISLDSSESDLIVKRKNLKNKEKVESDIHSSLLPNGDVESDEMYE